MHLDHLPAGTPLLKTLTFAVVHFSVAFSVAYLLTGSLGIASLLAMVEPLCNTVAYFFHEKLWGHLGRRRMPAGTLLDTKSRELSQISSLTGASS